MRQRVVQVYLRKFMVAVIATATVAGCSHTVTGSALRSDAGVPDPDRSYGYVDDRCGLLDNSTVQSTVGAEDVTRPYSGAVCQYILMRDAAGDSATVDVIFSWFDAGSLERERAVAAARGAAITEVVVERHKGFLARRDTTGAACSATAAAGSGVLSWWVQYRGQNAGDPCVDAEKLLSATLRSDL